MTAKSLDKNSRTPEAVACNDVLCTFAELKTSWFYLPRDPKKKPYFKCNERSAMGRDYIAFVISPNEKVMPLESGA